MYDTQAPLLDPSIIPSVPVASMNQTHREEVDLVNRLGTQLAEGMQGTPDTEGITATLTDWVEHTRHHFEEENLLMRQYGFPARVMHEEEHKRVLALLEKQLRLWRERRGIEALADFVFEEWPVWFDSHVNTMDWVTARFISIQGG